eukprot:TRINITY_DN981_c0_g1_i7.p1 TRINITY_DN981_c0_g1~~TRINITY_DN981_c0_g1_i7.p1  ORF type:complete len:247 (-),score=43.72 TRINITY_DN981_c0_g1_i7:736-1476(-)
MRLGTQYQPDGRGRDTFIFREPLLVHGKHGPTHLLAEPIYPVRDRLEMRYSQTKTRFRDVAPKVDTWRSLPLSGERETEDLYTFTRESNYADREANPHSRPRSTDSNPRRLNESNSQQHSQQHSQQRTQQRTRLPPVDLASPTASMSARKAPVWKHTPVARDPDGADVVKHSTLSGIAFIRDSYDPTPKLPAKKISATVDRLYKNHLYEPRPEDFEQNLDEDRQNSSRAGHVDYLRWPYPAKTVAK